jgi:hypothetical protein
MEAVLGCRGRSAALHVAECPYWLGTVPRACYAGNRNEAPRRLVDGRPGGRGGLPPHMNES